MTLYYLLWGAFLFWFIQQMNDFVGAFTNRKNVPKMYWVSAGASLVSGVLLFAFLRGFLEDVIAFAVVVISAIH